MNVYTESERVQTEGTIQLFFWRQNSVIYSASWDTWKPSVEYDDKVTIIQQLLTA